MKEIILKILNDISKGCGDKDDCQINFGSASARLMIAEALEKDLNLYFTNAIEDMFCPPTEDHCSNDECCGGSCHE